jgi:hypothetical protein
MARSRVRKTGETRDEWRMKFKEAVLYCKAHRAPGQKFQHCVRDYLLTHR